jgi:hypothetical protein
MQQQQAKYLATNIKAMEDKKHSKNDKIRAAKDTQLYQHKANPALLLLLLLLLLLF